MFAVVPDSFEEENDGRENEELKAAVTVVGEQESTGKSEGHNR